MKIENLKYINTGKYENIKKFHLEDRIDNHDITLSNYGNRIEAYVEPMNTASLKLLENLGFTKEGLLRQYELCRGGLIDITIWGLLRSDLK